MTLAKKKSAETVIAEEKLIPMKLHSVITELEHKRDRAREAAEQSASKRSTPKAS